MAGLGLAFLVIIALVVLAALVLLLSSVHDISRYFHIRKM